jgi:hypothetical protein
MTLRQARKWFDDNYDVIRETFYAIHTAPTGGLLNAKVVAVDNRGDLELRCHYDNYDNDEDAWTWFLNPGEMRFYS